MRLRSFRTQGFRCIKNSGTVALKDITALIGRNESGKTALLQSLLLLNKDSIIVDVDLTDGLEAEVDQSAFRVVEGTFELTAEESRTLNALGEGMPEIKNLTIYRESKSSQPNYDFGGITFPKLWATQEAGLPGFQKRLLAWLRERWRQPYLLAPRKKKRLALYLKS
jgi:predicted ATP-dependent endonuclease of OLD family